MFDVLNSNNRRLQDFKTCIIKRGGKKYTLGSKETTICLQLVNTNLKIESINNIASKRMGKDSPLKY
jgi:hypothetical protein